MIKLTEMKLLCDEQDAAERRYLEGFYGMRTGVKSVYARYSAASKAEIKAEEKRLGLRYPESYRTFLTVNNGWLRFGLGWTLVGVPRPENKDAVQWLKKSLIQSQGVVSKEEMAEVAKQEKRNRKVIAVANHIAFGTDMNYSLLLFDQNRFDSAGECEVAHLRYGVHVEQRWASFLDYFKFIRERTNRALVRLAETEKSAAAKQEKAVKDAQKKESAGAKKAVGSKRAGTRAKKK